MSLSLKQQLNNQNTNLGTIETNLATLQTQTAEAVAFHHNFVTSDANITVLVDRTTSNATKIGTLETTTTTQAGEIDTLEFDVATNSSRITNINNAFTAETDQIKLDLATETTNKGDADLNLQTNIDTEAGTRLTNDNTLQANIDAEAQARSNAEARMVFMNVAEAEGILTVGDYPFGYGFGSPSKVGFGVSIPFESTLTGIAGAVDSIDVSPSVQFFLENYNTSGSKVLPLSQSTDFSVLYDGSNKYLSNLGVDYTAGEICIKVVSPSNLTDADARYRITLFFQKTPALIGTGIGG